MWRNKNNAKFAGHTFSGSPKTRDESNFSDGRDDNVPWRKPNTRDFFIFRDIHTFPVMKSDLKPVTFENTWLFMLLFNKTRDDSRIFRDETVTDITYVTGFSTSALFQQSSFFCNIFTCMNINIRQFLMFTILVKWSGIAS